MPTTNLTPEQRAALIDEFKHTAYVCRARAENFESQDQHKAAEANLEMAANYEAMYTALESAPVLAHQVMVMRDALNAAATAQAAEEEENVSYECAMHCRIEAEAKLIKALALTPTAAEQTAKENAEKAAKLNQQTCLDRSSLAPSHCPVTGRPFFMAIEGPDGDMVATYGGPFDSYTIPVWDDGEQEFRSERYDHDMGDWVEGGEPYPFILVDESEQVSLTCELDSLRTQRDELAALVEAAWQLWPSEENEAAYPPDEQLVEIYCGRWESKDRVIGSVSKRCGVYGPSGATHWRPLPAPPATEGK